MYLCICIATNLQTIYLDWLQAALERNSRCAWWSRLSEFGDALGVRSRLNSEMHIEAVIERFSKYNWRPRSSELTDALGGCDQSSFGKDLEAVIDRIWRSTWRPMSCEVSDALWGSDRASLDNHLETEIAWTQRRTPRLWSSEFEDLHVEGSDRAGLKEYVEVVDLEAVDGRRARCSDSIHWLVNSKRWECD